MENFKHKLLTMKIAFIFASKPILFGSIRWTIFFFITIFTIITSNWHTICHISNNTLIDISFWTLFYTVADILCLTQWLGWEHVCTMTWVLRVYRSTYWSTHWGWIYCGVFCSSRVAWTWNFLSLAICASVFWLLWLLTVFVRDTAYLMRGACRTWNTICNRLMRLSLLGLFIEIILFK